MSTYNSDLVEFAVGLHPKYAEGCAEVEELLKGHNNTIVAMVRYYDKGTQNVITRSVIIDLDFLREVPIEDDFGYLNALAIIVGIPVLDNGWTMSLLLAIHNATIAQRLEAIRKSQGGEVARK